MNDAPSRELIVPADAERRYVAIYEPHRAPFDGPNARPRFGLTVGSELFGPVPGFDLSRAARWSRHLHREVVRFTRRSRIEVEPLTVSGPAVGELKAELDDLRARNLPADWVFRDRELILTYRFIEWRWAGRVGASLVLDKVGVRL